MCVQGTGCGTPRGVAGGPKDCVQRFQLRLADHLSSMLDKGRMLAGHKRERVTMLVGVDRGRHAHVRRPLRIAHRLTDQVHQRIAGAIRGPKERGFVAGMYAS